MFLSKALVGAFGEAAYSIMFYASCVFIVTSACILTFFFDETPIRKSPDESCDDNFEKVASINKSNFVQ